MKLLTRPARVGEAHTVASVIDQQISYLEVPAQQIADEVGFPKSNIISMIRHGRTKLPMNKVKKMATALKLDPIWFFSLVMNEYDPDGWAVMKDILEQPVVTPNEFTWVEAIRAANPDNLPAPTEASEAIRAMLKK